MKKNRMGSALLAVMMVISMMACIAVPVAAEEYTLPGDAENVTTVTAAVEGAQNYKIETISDLVHMAQYIAAYDRDDTVYLANDIDAADYPGGKEAFSTAYSAHSGTANLLASFDGLGHTLSNYTATRSLFGNFTPRDNGYLKNLVIENASVVVGSYAGLVIYKPDGVANGATTIIENVHVKNSSTESTSGNSASVFGYFNTGNTKSLILRDCSVVNTTVTSTCTYGAGLVLGAARTNAALLMENVLVVGCTLNNAGKGTEGGGFVVGDTRSGVTAAADTNRTTFKNIGVFNNTTVLSKDAVDGTGAALLTNGFGNKAASAARDIVIDGVYAANNKIKLNDNSLVDYDRLITFGKNKGANIVSAANYKTDTATYVMAQYNSTTSNTVAASADSIDADYTMWKTGLADLNASATYSNWGFDAEGNVALLETGEKTPVAVTFNNGTAAATYYTDGDGKLAVVADATKGFAAAKADDIAALAESTWAAVGNTDAANVTDWSQETFTADVTYHKLTVTPNTVGDEHKHDIACAVCDDHDQSGVACTETADPENSAELGYFSKKTDAYKCDVCGNTWAIVDENGTYAAPYSMEFDETEYVNNDSAVKVTVTPKTDADMSAMKFTLTYPADHLEYVGHESTVFSAMANKKSDGTLVVILAAANGQTLTAEDTITLNFKTKGLSETVVTADLKVEATLTETVVGSGNDTAIKEALTKVVSAEASASAITFTPGDVNDDDSIDALDAVLTIQLLNDTIGETQKADFVLRAADVDKSATIDTADIVLMLQFSCEMEVDLLISEKEPTYVSVGA